jgi:UrcA family protein
MKRLTTVILASALALSAQYVLAADMNDSPRQVDVHFADLDLSRVDGAAVLYQRLQSAAESVCMDFRTRDLLSNANARSCIAQAVSTAVAQVNRPVLNAYYRAKRGIGSDRMREASR